ncbi:MAG: class I SAM-dependent methyltransferase [Pseudomonadota bacterium]
MNRFLAPHVESHIGQHLVHLPRPLAIELPQGQTLGPPDAAVKLMLSAWSSVARLKAGQIGALAEDIVEGKIRIEGRMRDIMAVVTGLLPGNPVASDTKWWTEVLRRAKSLTSHTREKDAAQIQFHYDVSDDFYALWLDPRRVYSCAYYAASDMSLAQAQEAKLDLICRKLMLKPGERFLDIGAGWGALLLWAAEHYGVDATGITLSRNQHAHMQKLIAEKGLQGRVRMELRDYRDVTAEQPYDKISSVGMFEHVGHANMDAYFNRIWRLLAPGGLVLNHGITAGSVANQPLGAGMGDFIGKYIFPGGELLHVSTVMSHLSRAGLEMVDTENLRPHYARTLWAWSDALEARLPEARRILTADTGAERAEKTLRAYRLYLAGCAMSFEQGWIALHQLLATRPNGDVETAEEGLRGAQSRYPFRRSYMY